MKPPFLNSPAIWLRSGSCMTDRVRYACAVEVPTRPGFWQRVGQWFARFFT